MAAYTVPSTNSHAERLPEEALQRIVWWSTTNRVGLAGGIFYPSNQPIPSRQGLTTLLASAVDCEDAIQEALLRAWRHADDVRDEKHFDTWLIRILINECRRVARKGRRTAAFVPEDPPARNPALQEALQALEEKYRLVVVMHYLEGYSVDELARILRLPAGTVKWRLKRARAAAGIPERGGCPMKAWLRDALPPMTEDFHNRLVTTLEEVTEMKRTSRRIGLLVAALILILALSGIAFAAVRSGLMDALFYGRTPSPEAERLVAKAAASDIEVGITASIDEYIRDGNTLTVSWSVESALDEPVLIRDDIQLTTRVGDVNLRQMSGSGDMDMFAIVLGGSTGGHTFPRRQSATTTFEIPDGLSEKPIQLALDTKGVYRLDKPLQYVKDAVGGDWSDAPGGYKTIEAILVDESGRTEPYDYPGVSERVGKAWEAAGKPSHEDGKAHYDAYDAMADLGLISRLAAPRATADAVPTDAAQTRSTKVNGPSTFEFDGYTLRVEKLDFSAASTSIILTASPKPARPIADSQDSYDPLLTSYYVLDKDGNNLLGNISGGWDVLFDGVDSSGNPCIRYVYHGNPLTEAPDSVIIVPSSEMQDPYDGNDGPGSASYEAYEKAHFLMDQAVTVEVAPQ